MKIIKTASFHKTALSMANIEPNDLADAIASEMEEIDSRAIARERAIANLTKDHGYYKKKREKPKTGEGK